MKRAGDVISAVGASRSNEAAPTSTRCAAYGCPMSGTISDSTKGGGTWYCRFHFQASPRAFDAISEDVRNRARSGDLFAAGEPTPSVASMRDRMKRGLAARPAVAEREPGSDDE